MNIYFSASLEVPVTLLNDKMITTSKYFCVVKKKNVYFIFSGTNENIIYHIKFQEETVHGGFRIHPTYDAPRGRKVLPDQSRRARTAKPVEREFSATGEEISFPTNGSEFPSSLGFSCKTYLRGDALHQMFFSGYFILNYLFIYFKRMLYCSVCEEIGVLTEVNWTFFHLIFLSSTCSQDFKYRNYIFPLLLLGFLHNYFFFFKVPDLLFCIFWHWEFLHADSWDFCAKHSPGVIWAVVLSEGPTNHETPPGWNWL